MKIQLLVINLLILLLLISMSCYTYLNAYAWQWTIISSMVAILWLIYISRSMTLKRRKSHLQTISLLDEQEKVIKEWHIAKEQGLLIGKQTPRQTVDIDLSEADYAVLIDEEHATLNCVNGQWYVEDLNSENGTGVKLPDQLRIKKLQEKEQVKVCSDTRLYIGKTILLLKKG